MKYVFENICDKKVTCAGHWGGTMEEKPAETGGKPQLPKTDKHL